MQLLRSVGSTMLTLIVQDFPTPCPDRRAEFDACLRANLAHEAVTSVIDLAEGGYENPATQGHPKLHRAPQATRMTFADAVAAGNALVPADSVVVLLNLDVHLVGSGWAQHVGHFLPPRSSVALCLGRHESVDYCQQSGVSGRVLLVSEQLAGLCHAHSQDAWAWRTPLHVDDAAFCLGTIGCDNAFAERLARAGRTLLNPMFDLIVAHRDASAVQNAYRRRPAQAQAEAKPEERGSMLVPALDPLSEGGGAEHAIATIVKSLSPESQAQMASQLYNQLIRIKN
jgi:hypothetical protein